MVRRWSSRGAALRVSKMGRPALVAASATRYGRPTGRCGHGRPYLAIRSWRAAKESPAAPTPPSGGASLFLQGTRTAPASMAAMAVRKVLLASPRGYCAGVERAVETVEKALDLY